MSEEENGRRSDEEWTSVLRFVALISPNLGPVLELLGSDRMVSAASIEPATLLAEIEKALDAALDVVPSDRRLSRAMSEFLRWVRALLDDSRSRLEGMMRVAWDGGRTLGSRLHQVDIERGRSSVRELFHEIWGVRDRWLGVTAVLSADLPESEAAAHQLVAAAADLIEMGYSALLTFGLRLEGVPSHPKSTLGGLMRASRSMTWSRALDDEEARSFRNADAHPRANARVRFDPATKRILVDRTADGLSLSVAELRALALEKAARLLAFFGGAVDEFLAPMFTVLDRQGWRMGRESPTSGESP